MANTLTALAVPFAEAAQGTDLRPLILIPGIGMVLVGAGFFAYAWRRQLGLRYFSLGALAWIVSVALKFAWATRVNSSIYSTLVTRLPVSLGLPIFEVYVGLLTGVFEVALVWLVLNRSHLGRATWRKVLAFGIGFGATEAILLGLVSLVNGVIALVAPGQLTDATLAKNALANDLLYGAAPIVERAAIIWVHIFSAALIFFGIAAGQGRWVWSAIVYKTAVDSVAAFAQFWGVETLGRYWTIELIILAFGLVGWWGTRWVSRRYPARTAHGPLEPELVPSA